MTVANRVFASRALFAGGRRPSAGALRRERLRRRLRDWVRRALLRGGAPAPVPLVREVRRRRVGRRCRPAERGFTLMELLAAAALVSVLAAMAAPPLVASFRAQRVRHAAMAMRSLLQRARAEAAARAANVAVVFNPPARGAGGGAGPSGGSSTEPPVVAVYMDANHNGVRRAEIAAGRERLLRAGWRFDERFSGVEWGASAEAAGGTAIPGLAVGAARMVSFSPLGSSGAGRITVSGGGVVYSIVIHGGSSRIRLERRAGTVWVPA